ncbi:MAG: hypothetical protein H7837_11165 [Magnetococcus sp. MYC-9]
MKKPILNPLFACYGEKTLELLDSDRSGTRTGGPAPGGAQGHLHTHSHPFQQALEAGDETLVRDSPLHLFTKKLFLDSMKNLEQRFMAAQAALLDHPPRPNISFPSHREIWAGAKGSPRILSRIGATFAQWTASVKPPLAALLFGGSTLTTAWGINEWVQTPMAEMLFGHAFSGENGEMARTLVALTMGVLFSVSILDFKERLFRNIAETGGVLRGIRHALLRHPRWMALAGVLTLVSIKTNYDGLVTLFSKPLELSSQLQGIRQQVEKALGSPESASQGNLDSLYGLHVRLNEQVEAVLKRLDLLPDDEREGRASSNFAYPGPRYWGKHYIIHGGYEPGRQDVRHTFGDRPLAEQVDQMLMHSGIDLSTSIASKLTTLVEQHRATLRTVSASARQRFDALEKSIQEVRSPLPGFNRVFFLEHYQVNEVVEKVVADMESSRHAYDAGMEALQSLLARYVPLLEDVDKSGGAHLNNYRVEVSVAPEIEALEILKRQRIPLASHKSIEALKAFFTEHYGALLAPLFLLAVLMLAVGMDLADILLLARRTARLGRRDREQVVAALGEILEWEQNFISSAERFFRDPELQHMLPGVPMPNTLCLRDAFYRLLEAIEPATRSREDQTAVQRTLSWFKSLFLTVRIADMEGCVARMRAIHRLARHNPVPRLLVDLLPAAMEPHIILNTPTLHELAQKIKEGQSGQQLRFVHACHRARAGKPLPEPASHAGGRGLPLVLQKLNNDHSGRIMIETLMRTEQSVDTLAGNVGHKGSSGQKGWTNSLLDTVCQRTFMAPLPPFAHTRRYWLQGLPPLTEDDGGTKARIRGFVPKLAAAREKVLPKIRQEALQPLLEISHRLAFQLGGQSMMQIRNLEKRYQHLTGELDELHAACQGLEREQPMLYTDMGGMDLEQITRLVYPRINGTPFIVEKIHTLQEELCATLHRVRGKEERIGVAANRRIASIHNACGELHRRVLTHNMRTMESPKKNRFLSRNAKQTALGAHELSHAVERARSIQTELARFEHRSAPHDDQQLAHLQALAEESILLLHRVRQQTSDPMINPFHILPETESEVEEWSGSLQGQEYGVQQGIRNNVIFFEQERARQGRGAVQLATA